MKGAKPVKIVGKTKYRPRIRQYPLKPDAEEGIAPVIAELKRAGVIISGRHFRVSEPCVLCCGTRF